jgi:hypothetical protein
MLILSLVKYGGDVTSSGMISIRNLLKTHSETLCFHEPTFVSIRKVVYIRTEIKYGINS